MGLGSARFHLCARPPEAPCVRCVHRVTSPRVAWLFPACRLSPSPLSCRLGFFSASCAPILRDSCICAGRANRGRLKGARPLQAIGISRSEATACAAGARHSGSGLATLAFTDAPNCFDALHMLPFMLGQFHSARLTQLLAFSTFCDLRLGLGVLKSENLESDLDRTAQLRA